MAKKKKKKASEALSPTPHKQKQQQARAGERPVPHDEPEDFILLKLKQFSTANNNNNNKTPSTRTIAETPKLIVNNQDAQRINVSPRDEVLILIQKETSATATATANKLQFVGALLCHVETYSASTTSPATSPTKRPVSVTAGTCQIQPWQAVEKLLLTSEEEKETGLTDQATVHESSQTNFTTISNNKNNSTFQTPSKSGFSFAVGGGGDALISPLHSTPPHETTPRTSSASISQNKAPLQTKVIIWILPVSSSPVGKDAVRILCQNAHQVHVQLTEKDVALQQQFLNCRRILTQLCLAQCLGRNIHSIDTITISFQGKPLSLQMTVKEPQGATEARSQHLLELEFETLDIDDNNDNINLDNDSNNFDVLEARLWRSLKRALNEDSSAKRGSSCRNNLLLHKMTKTTTLTFSHESDSNTTADESDNSNNNNVNSPPLPKRQVVAGLDDIMVKLKSLLLTPLLKPNMFAASGSLSSMKPPRGVLLHGSPGVGKSCLARQLALDLEHDHQGKIRVESVNCASLQSYSAQVGEAERRLCSIFEKASRQGMNHQQDADVSTASSTGGTLLIFDDIQLICRKRSGYNAGSDRLAATLLGLLDGIGSTSNSSTTAISRSIVILGITSDPSALDPALRRPGRLDFELEVPGPDEASTRAKILDFHMKDLGQNYSLPTFTNKDLLTLGELAKGFNGADCMLAVKEALRIAIFRRQNENTRPNSPLSLADFKTAIRATKPSAIKSITVEIPTVLWSSIGGMEQVKAELREAIELPLTHGHLFEKLNIPPPRGILLYGPPGCSKTLMARALATEGKMNFLAVKGPELLSKWLGESERALASLFRRARMASPSIIFFDEIDAIAASRGSEGIGTGGGRLLSQLLTELDGVNQTGGVTLGSNDKKPSRVVVVAATNRPDLIDSALMRPGRIDRKILVGVPDRKSREGIFKIGLKGRACSDCIDVSYTVQLSRLNLIYANFFLHTTF